MAKRNAYGSFVREENSITVTFSDGSIHRLEPDHLDPGVRQGALILGLTNTLRDAGAGLSGQDFKAAVLARWQTLRGGRWEKIDRQPKVVVTLADVIEALKRLLPPEKHAGMVAKVSAMTEEGWMSLAKRKDVKPTVDLVIAERRAAGAAPTANLDEMF
jgi:hypothetical protein